MKRYQPWLTLLARLVLGGTLLAAGLLKIKNPSEAAASVRVYKMLPVALANILGYSLPWIEIGVALLLILGVSVKKISLVSVVLMVMFIIAVGQAWARGLPINCGCFGNGGITTDGKVHALTYFTEIARDLGLLILAIYAYRFPQGKFGLDKLDKFEPEENHGE